MSLRSISAYSGTGLLVAAALFAVIVLSSLVFRCGLLVSHALKHGYDLLVDDKASLEVTEDDLFEGFDLCVEDWGAAELAAPPFNVGVAHRFYQ